MTTLNFGVIDIPYSLASYGAATKMRRLGRAKRGKATAPKTNDAAAKTTGDVAAILEDKYSIFETFYEDVGGAAIAAIFEKSLAGTMENIAAGQTGNISLSAEAESEIETTFRVWLGDEKMNGRTAGVPTQAALAGVNHRMLHPYAKRGPRPSFIDTGLFQANAKVWLDT
jgi:hypothetical protein